MRETECKQGRGRERGRHRIRNRLQAQSGQPRARHGARTHEPWDRDLSRSQMLNRLSHSGAPFSHYTLQIFLHQSNLCHTCISNPSLASDFFFLILFLRERQSTSRGGVVREGDTESKAGSRLWAVGTEPDAEIEPTNCEIMTWAENGRSTNWATQAPPFQFK